MSEKIFDVEQNCGDFAAAHANLADLLKELNEEQEKIRNKKQKRITEAYQIYAEKKEALYGCIVDNADLFIKPKSRIFHGIKVGYKKQTGKVEIANIANSIKLIKDKFPEESKTAIVLMEGLNKEVLSTMTGDQLKKIGVSISKDIDEVIIKPTASEVEKTIQALEEEMDKELKEAIK